MTKGVFVDSTTLLYSQDRRDPPKQQRAAAWLERLVDTNELVLSLQVLNETYAVVRRKSESAHWRQDVRAFLLDQALWAASLTAEDMQEAWRLEDRYQVGHWDALLLASAIHAGCACFLSEDLNDGQVYGSVRVLNPFRHAPEDVLGPAVSS